MKAKIPFILFMTFLGSGCNRFTSDTDIEREEEYQEGDFREKGQERSLPRGTELDDGRDVLGDDQVELNQ
jgi:hypothetical protein